MGSSHSTSDSRSIGPILGNIGDIIKLQLFFNANGIIPETLYKEISDVFVSDKMIEYITLIMNMPDVANSVRYPFQIKLYQKYAAVEIQPDTVVLSIRAKLVARQPWSEINKKSGSYLSYFRFPFRDNDELNRELSKPLSNNFEKFMQNARASFVHDDRAGGYTHSMVVKRVPYMKRRNVFFDFRSMRFVNQDAYIFVKDDLYY